MIVPNSVGRIDAIVDAIRDGDIERATALCNWERSRLIQKCRNLKAEHKKALDAERELHEFLRSVWSDGTIWHQARRDCGWNGEVE